ncbi:GNAT family N-acetyltransferase [Glutamicibacter sp. AOP38-B1-38]|uniref:GNAT family N-acetyltransferase n=1 Tax=Glutamicibacter sp. AOP38-B1-38 TaxID=3457680 RepID=UPI0040333EAD
MSEFSGPEDLSTEHRQAQVVIDGERQLLSPIVRQDRQALLRLLHEDFEEVGASGRCYSRAQIIEQLCTEPVVESSRDEVHDPRVRRLSDSLLMLRWRTKPENPSQRTSLWVRSAQGWQLLFHQGTAQAASSQIGGGRLGAVSETTASLRPLRATDAPHVLAAFLSNPDMARQGEVSTLAEAETYVRMLLKDPARQVPLAVVENSALVGLVCGSIDETNLSAWVWYWLHAEHRGRGLSSRALAALSAELFSSYRLQRLELGLRVNNPASKKVAERCGFILEGRERGKFLIDGQRIDVLNYARLPTDPIPPISPLALRAEPAGD